MKYLFSLALLLFWRAPSKAQYAALDIFNNTPLVFYGIDFTKARIENPFYNQEELRSHYFPEWNYLFLQEANKTALRQTFERNNVRVDIDAVLQVNATHKFNSQIGASLERTVIEDAVQQFKAPEQKGIGVVLFAGELKDKGEVFYGKLAFFDIQTKKLLMLKKVYGEGASFGFRNTVAMAIKHSLIYTRKKWGGWRERVS